MRQKLWIVLAVIVVGVPAIGFLLTRTVRARVLGKTERIAIDSSTGQWRHRYTIAVGPVSDVDSNTVVGDTMSVTVGRVQYDASRIGARVRIGRTAGISALSWIADTSTPWQTFLQFIAAHRRFSSSPKAVSSLDAQTAGLARVIAVHAIELPKLSSQKQGDSNNNRSRWIHLVEVEFWAQRTRTLVRTIDVIDAASIPGLRPGDVVQMHFDQRNPRVLRLDDGMRTFDGQRM